MLRKLFWIAVLVAAIFGAKWFFSSAAPSTRPNASPRSALVEFCRGVQMSSPVVMENVCTGQGRTQIQEIINELDTRSRRGAPIVQAWPEGSTAPSGDHAQGLIMVRDRTGNTLPMWDAYLQRDTNGAWWIERFTERQ